MRISDWSSDVCSSDLFSTAKRPAVDGRAPVQCDLYIRCNGFRAAIPTVAQMLGERGEGQGGRFEFTEIGDPEASILRRLISSHLAGTDLTLEQLAAQADSHRSEERRVGKEGVGTCRARG